MFTSYFMFKACRRFAAACACSLLLVSALSWSNVAASTLDDVGQRTKGVVLSGEWSGSWNSETTGHKGPLRANIRPTGDGNYTATFTGKFFKVIPFRYQMQLNVVSSDEGELRLAGSKKLGPLMGYYSYQATVSGNRFLATYRTKRDRGTFTLRR